MERTRAWIVDASGSRYIPSDAGEAMREWPLVLVHEFSPPSSRIGGSRSGGSRGGAKKVQVWAMGPPPSGSVGPKGSQGPKGPKGSKGDVGPVGPKGNVGPKGHVGPVDKKTTDFVKEAIVPVLEYTWNILSKITGRDGSTFDSVDLIYVDVLSPRLLPSVPGASIDCDHINGGLTQTNVSVPGHGGEAKVMVYRREDAGKVLMHELIHLFDMGPKSLGVEAVEQYTEAVAIHLWAQYVGEDYITTSERVVGVARDAVEHFGGRVENWKETTHAYSYVVVRAAIWSRPENVRRLLGLKHPVDSKEFERLTADALSPSFFRSLDKNW